MKVAVQPSITAGPEPYAYVRSWACSVGLMVELVIGFCRQTYFDTSREP